MLAALGVGAMAGGSLLSGFFGSNQKKNEAAVAKYNAALMFQRAEAIKKKTKFQQVRQAEEGARIQGELEAGIGGSGTVSTQGAPLLSLALQKTESSLQNYLIGYEGRMAAGEAESQGLDFLMQAKQAKIGARQSLLGGFLGAGASALSGYAKTSQPAAPAGTAQYGGFGGGTMSSRVAGSGYASRNLPSFR